VLRENGPKRFPARHTEKDINGTSEPKGWVTARKVRKKTGANGQTFKGREDGNQSRKQANECWERIPKSRTKKRLGPSRLET